MKKYFYLATALVALAACSGNEFLGDPEALNSSGSGAISFNMSTPAMTRTETAQDHTTSAATLNSQFIVWGEKSSAAESGSAGTPVFVNYVVKYGASTANTTESNSRDWEYVAQTPYADSKVVASAAPTHVTEQTIKYWDFTNKYYTFTAISAKPADISDGKVKITKNVSGSTKYDKGYTVDLKSDASVNDIYFADRTLVEAGDGTKSTPVNLKFRNLVSQVRFGFYETVPGYDVAITDVKYNSTSHTANGAGNFGVDCEGAVLVPGASTSFTVTYDNGSVISANENKAKVAVAGSNTQNYLSTTATSFFGTTLGTASNERTWENSGNYTKILPNPSNTTDLTLTISYQLTSTDNSGETIDITDAVVKVPAAFAQWQSNFAYTYLFKITDKNGLYPITFDAVVITDEAGNQETITTVDDPSITTYAKGEVVTANNEYLTGSNIYVVVDKSGTVQELSAANAKLYLVTNTTGSGATQKITETSVANALAHGEKDNPTTPTTWTVTGVGMKSLIVTTTGVPTLATTSSIPAADSPTGVVINLDGTNNKCAKFTPAAPTFNVVASGTALSAGETYYTAADGSTKTTLDADVASAPADTYWTKTSSAGYYVFEYTDGSSNKYYKVIKFVDKY